MDIPGLETLEPPAPQSAPFQPAPPSAQGSWFALALHPATLRRALITACVVGLTLIAINHGAAILSGTVTRGRILQMCLTVVVPYLVSTTASVATRRELAAGRAREQSS